MHEILRSKGTDMKGNMLELGPNIHLQIMKKNLNPVQIIHEAHTSNSEISERTYD